MIEQSFKECDSDVVAYKRAIDERNAIREETKQTLSHDQQKDSELNEAHRPFIQSKPAHNLKCHPDFNSNEGVYAQTRGVLEDRINKLHRVVNLKLKKYLSNSFQKKPLLKLNRKLRIQAHYA